MTTPQQAALTAFLGRATTNTLNAADQSLLSAALSEIIPIWGFDDSGAGPDMAGNAGQIDLANSRQWMAVLYAVANGLAGGGGVGGVGDSFVFQPGGVAVGNTFTSWAPLAAAIAAQPGFRRVLVDTSLSSPAHITAGGPYDINNTTFFSGGGSTRATLVFDDGATITPATTNITFDSISVQVAATGANTVWTPATRGKLVFMNQASMTTSGTAPFGDFAVPYVFFAVQASTLGTGTTPAFAVEPAGNGTVNITTDSLLQANVFKQGGGGPGGSLSIVADGSASVLLSPTQVPAPTIRTIDPQPTFVFRPGAVGAQDGNVYTTWAALVAATSQLPSQPRTVIIDDTLAAAHMVAGGPYDLDNWTLLFQQSSPTFTLHIDEGATFTSFSLDIVSGTVSNDANATIPWTPNNFFTLTLRGDSGVLKSTANIPFVHVGAAASGSVILMNDSAGLGSAGAAQHVVTVDAGQQVQVVLNGFSEVFNHALTGAGTALVDEASSASLQLPQDVTTLNTVLISTAARTAYAPGTPGNWNPAPTTTAGGLDQLASPNSSEVTNAGILGPALTVTVTAAALTKKRTGIYSVLAELSGTSASVGGDTISLQLLRDATVIAEQDVATATFAGSNGRWQCTLSALDTVPDAAAHTYSATATGGSNITVQVGFAQIFALES